MLILKVEGNINISSSISNTIILKHFFQLNEILKLLKITRTSNQLTYQLYLSTFGFTMKLGEKIKAILGMLNCRRYGIR